MKRTRPEHIGDILAAMQTKSALGKHLEHAKIWEQWERLAGAHLAKHCKPHSVKKGQLRILVESPVWMHKLGYLKWDLLRRINRMAGKELVNDIFMTLASDEDAVRALDKE